MILFVDPNEYNQMMFAEALGKINRTLPHSVVESGKRAILKMLELQFDFKIIFINSRLRDVSCKMLIEFVQSQDIDQRIHIVVVSDVANGKNFLRHQEPGIDYFKIDKDFNTFCQSLGSLINKHFN